MGFFDGLLNNAAITINENGELSGTLSLTANLAEDETIDNSYVIKKNQYGDFKFTYDGTADYEGEFDLSGVKSVEVDLVKYNTVLATMSDGSFDVNGTIRGKFVIPEGLNPSYTTPYFTASVNSLDVDAVYSTKDGFKFTGSASIKFSQFKEMSGSVDLTARYQDGVISTEMTTEGISAFGMELTKLNLAADFNKSFELESISGSMEAKHSELSASVAINEFLYTEQGLQKFIASGEFSYQYGGESVEFILEKCEYLPDEKAILLDAMALKVDDGSEDKDRKGTKVAVAVKPIMGNFSSESKVESTIILLLSSTAFNSSCFK